MNHINYDLGCKIINHPVFNEVIDAGDVAYDILTNVTKILQNTGEFKSWTMQPNKYWFSVSWPLDIREGGLDAELYDACQSVLDFSNELNELDYEEHYLCNPF